MSIAKLITKVKRCVEVLTEIAEEADAINLEMSYTLDRYRRALECVLSEGYFIDDNGQECPICILKNRITTEALEEDRDE